jgi:hypothetical protein
MRNGMAILGGLALGAGLMYVLDPERGRRRRALMTDKMTSWCNRSARATGSKARHLSNRAKGIMHETGSAIAAAAGVMAGGANSTEDSDATTNQASTGTETNLPLSNAAGAR